MGLWAEIKLALNSTLGKNLKPLNRIIEERAYDCFYEMAEMGILTYGDNGGATVAISKGIGSIVTTPPAFPGVIHIIVPNGVELSDGAFLGAINLEKVNLPPTLKTISQKAFMDCSALRYIEIPVSVETIKTQSFANCTSLETITLGGDLKDIQAYVFSGCAALTRIEFRGTMSQWQNITKTTNWDNGTGNYTVYCTDGTVAKE